MAANLAQLLVECTAIAEQAGKAILSLYYSQEWTTEKKYDGSPVTTADIVANDIVVDGLGRIADYPFISEELTPVDYSLRAAWPRYWLIDPLDGTRDFIEKTDDFSVNIALIEHGEPILGVIYAPVTGITHAAARGLGAFKKTAEGVIEYLSPCLTQPDVTRIVISRRRIGPKTQLNLTHFGSYELQFRGSALKFCDLAEGLADVYPCFGRISEWDTAAGHCILNEMGGEIFDFQGEKLRYNTRDSLINPPFLAVANARIDWITRFNLTRQL